MYLNLTQIKVNLYVQLLMLYKQKDFFWTPTHGSKTTWFKTHCFTPSPLNNILILSRAVGHMTYGSAYREQIVDKVRKAAEHCDCLQCFFLIHSMGGGKTQ